MTTSNIFKKKIAVLLLAVFILTIPGDLFAFRIGAGGLVPGLPFGGPVVLILPCTCSASLWIWFAPLSPSPPLPPTGPLIYQPGYTTLYGNFAIGLMATWHLGSYTPVVGNGVCWEETAIACVPIPNLGLMNKVGTGLP